MGCICIDSAVIPMHLCTAIIIYLHVPVFFDAHAYVFRQWPVGISVGTYLTSIRIRHLKVVSSQFVAFQIILNVHAIV